MPKYFQLLPLNRNSIVARMPSSQKTTAGARVTMALLAVQVFYGVHYLAAKWIVSEMAPCAWAVLRTVSAWLIVLAIALAMKRRLPPWRDVGILAVCAFFGITLNQALFLEGIVRTTAAHSALINSQIPSFALLWALILGKEIAYIPQSAMNALNPTRKIINFIEDVVQAHDPYKTKKEI